MASTLAVQSPADAVNLAFVRMGFKGRIGNLFDGSMAAKKALDIYAQTRDELLRAGNWGFAQRNIALTLLKQAPSNGYIPPLTWSPIYPPLPFLFEYLYPSDCLDVRAVKPVPLFVPNFDPQPYIFSVDNDNAITGQAFTSAKVILCNVPSAILVYTGQVTDPTQWETDFVEVFASALARRLAPVLTGLDAAKLEAADEQSSTMIAENKQG